ncbi:MAG: IS701 family transposase [Deltaproteobacteria bacterium]|nr:IS701 family transposase [Deltaproteobacteria bacterium]
MADSKRVAGGRWDEYVARLSGVIGHRDREEPLRAYLAGLLLPGERKSVEPMAARLDPRHVSARHQSMHHFISGAAWSDDEVLRVARDYVLPLMERHAPVGAWIVDDTGMPKKGVHSAGVSRQYCGVLGKQENCQVAVTVSLANTVMSVPGAYRLYLPETWAKDHKRRNAAGVPSDIVFRTKWEIALTQIDDLLADDLPRSPVLADAGYGNVTEFREALCARGLRYAVGINPETRVWPPGIEPLPAKPSTGRGRPPRLLRRDAGHRPESAEALARSLGDDAWRTVRWREGTRGTMSSRFAAVRVRAAHRDYWKAEPREREWLVIEWPPREKKPAKYWLSTAPETTEIDDLVRLIKLRWRIERDHEEMKQELGLDHYEGRGWRGFHHHGVLCVAAYAFLAAERARLSPPEPLAFLKAAPLPKSFRPRGSPDTVRTSQPRVHRDDTH